MNAFTERLVPTVTNMIRMDHAHVLTTFHQYEIDCSPKKKQTLVDGVCLALDIHAQLEEEIFYPALRGLTAHNALLESSVPEHDEMRASIAQLRSMQPTDANYDATFMALMKIVLHHVADEETTLLPEAERLLKDRLGELGVQMTKRRLQLAAPHAGELAWRTVRGLPASSLLLAGGALIAGSYVLKRAGNRHHVGS